MKNLALTTDIMVLQQAENSGQDPGTAAALYGTLTRSLSPSLKASLDVRHFTQNADTALNSYDENRASLFVNKTF